MPNYERNIFRPLGDLAIASIRKLPEEEQAGAIAEATDVFCEIATRAHSPNLRTDALKEAARVGFEAATGQKQPPPQSPRFS